MIVIHVSVKSSSTGGEAAMLGHHVSHARGFPECYPDITAGVRSCENTSEKWGLMSIFSAVRFLAIRCHLIGHAGPLILK